MSKSLSEDSTKHSVIEVFITFLKLGLTSFGGPIAHLGYFRKELMEKRQWVSESQFSQLLAICQFLPGPASSQMGFVLGLLRAGWLGAIAAFLAFTLPSVIILMGFAAALPYISGPIGDSAIHGLKLVACAVVADAVLGMTKSLCTDTYRRTIAVLAASIILILGTAWSQILVVVGGAITGIFLCRVPITEKDQGQITVSYNKLFGFILLALFCLLFALTLISNQDGLSFIAQVFYRAGSMVFGGGHVVLPLLQESVVDSGMISNDSFLAGYGAAQAIPGPMFAFSAYMGAIIPNGQGSLLGAGVALIFMFLPGFLLILAVLPMWQAISHKPTAVNAIAGVNAAVVGVLGAALYDPIFTSGITSNGDLAIAIIGFAMLAIWRLSTLYVVLWCVAASVISVLL